MTSPATHAETVSFLEENDRFGLAPEDLYVFSQGTMPAVDADTGKVLLTAPGKVFFSPDGHGGALAALQREGCFDDIGRRGVEQLYYFQIDNPLVDICRPELIGYHLLAKSEMTTEVISKEQPEDKLGVVVSIEDRLQVIEYSDLPISAANQRDDDGSLTLWAGSIAIHVFDMAFLLRVADQADALPFHRSHTKVPFVDNARELQKPDQPNAIKFERFIFDLLPSARKGIVVEVKEKNGFAPLKNAARAKDTHEWVKYLILTKHTNMIRNVGAHVDENILVEISPLFAVDANGLGAKIDDGLTITETTYFQ